MRRSRSDTPPLKPYNRLKPPARRAQRKKITPRSKVPNHRNNERAVAIDVLYAFVYNPLQVKIHALTRRRSSVVEQGTHKPLVVCSNHTVAT